MEYPQLNPNGVGVTQIKDMRPKRTLVINGTEWHLRKDATDGLTIFPHEVIKLVDAGCEPLPNGKAFFCWILGLFTPATGGLERPLQVMYVGVAPNQIAKFHEVFTMADRSRMHVYAADNTSLSSTFLSQFFGVEQPVAASQPVAPVIPEMLSMDVLKEEVQAPVKASQKAKPNGNEVGEANG